MSMGAEMALDAMIDEFLYDDGYHAGYNDCGQYGHITHWKSAGGKIIALKDMTNQHLRNTIKFLERQIDGSLHDEFVHDNIIAMKNELNRRKNDYGTNSECRP